MCCQPMGKWALEKLTAAGAKADMLESSIGFVVFAHFAKPFKISAVRGYSRKSLDLVAKDLRHVAVHIERISENPFYLMAIHQVLPGPHWKTIPADLRKYAEVLESTIRVVRELGRKNPREYDILLFSKRRLISEVFMETGKPHYNWLAALLNAAYMAAGLESYEEASRLRHLWETYAKKVVKRERLRNPASVMTS
jgi:hypothetical protein